MSTQVEAQQVEVVDPNQGPRRHVRLGHFQLGAGIICMVAAALLYAAVPCAIIAGIAGIVFILLGLSEIRFPHLVK